MSELFSRDEIETRLAELQARVGAALAPYEANSAARDLLEMLRAVEELINLGTVAWDDDAFEEQLYGFPVFRSGQHLLQLAHVRKRLAARFDSALVDRLSLLILQGSDIGVAFARHGALEAASGFQSVEAMMGYLQSRRRHLVGLLHFVPTACRGSRLLNQHEALNVFLPIVEFSAAPMMGAQYALMVKLAQERLGIPEDPAAEVAMLDSLFLEPERASISEMHESADGSQLLESKEPLRPDRLFTAAELRNDILHTETLYAEFDLCDTEFAVAATLVRRLSKDFVDDDYWIRISPAELATLTAEAGASPALVAALTCEAATYMECLSTYAPFVLVGDHYLSTVSLLSRFIYSWRAQVLERKKRFQIRAGFIFEGSVKAVLEKQGFVVQDIVRINRQEFDVVALRDDVIWNVQCKNNFIGLSRVDSDAVAFARYNRGLVMSYEKALVKERNREHLLKMKLAIEAVQHMVVSRFPVVTNNRRIVVFNRIDEFAERADAILAASGGARPHV
jgi:hypothetical protein